jgi:hypothetical protein
MNLPVIGPGDNDPFSIARSPLVAVSKCFESAVPVPWIIEKEGG